IEQQMKLRRPPFSAPALVGGHRPMAQTTTAHFRDASGPSVTVNLSYDGSASRLSYALQFDPPGGDRIVAVWIHTGTAQKPGAARHQLFTAGGTPEGTVTLSAADRRDLADRK